MRLVSRASIEKTVHRCDRRIIVVFRTDGAQAAQGDVPGDGLYMQRKVSHNLAVNQVFIGRIACE